MTHKDPLHEFLRAVRRRLWWMASRARLRAFAWRQGGLLLLLAAVHHLLIPVPPGMVLLATLLLLAATLGQCLRDRPSMQATAASADREFAGEALLTTALDCEGRPALAGAPAVEVILRRARLAAAEWHARLNGAFRAPQPAAAMLAIVPLFAGATLLWIPGKQAESPASVQAAQGSAGSSADRDAQSATRAADVARLADAVAADSSVANPAIAAVADLPTDAATVARDPSPGREPESAGAVPDDAVSRAAATSSGGQGEQAGDALPATDSVVSEAPRRAQFSRRELVFLQRTGALRSVGEAGDADYRSAEADATPATLAVIAAAAPELQVARATLTAAEAALGNRYLETSGEINE